MSSPRIASCETLVIVPTLREKDNIITLMAGLGALSDPVDLLVVDDASDDGTRDMLRDRMAQGARITLLNRPGRCGLGTAYTLALACARRCGYRHVVQMDADGSHDWRSIPALIEALRGRQGGRRGPGRDMVIGSRYVPGGGAEGWSPWRWRLSRLANLLARTVVGGRLCDVTGGFRCTRGTFLRKLPLERVVSRGFSWQWEFSRMVLRAGGRVTEVPICFHERASGRSKLDWSIVREGLLRLVQLHLTGRPRFEARLTRPVASRPTPAH